jgi:(E)-4-hydroxy-3-methyl-but-2-enyl pyrophosphate reductase
MKVVLANSAGFCMGVRRAVDITTDIAQQVDGKVATYGPLVHNSHVLNMLNKRGVKTLKELPSQYSGTIIIRAHGVPPATKKILYNSGAHVEDATCPHVKQIQAIITKYKVLGYSIIILGNNNHAEVIGLNGYAGDYGMVVSHEQDIATLEINGPYIIVCQTTMKKETYEHLKQEIITRFPEGKIFNTICEATHKRQDEVRELCQAVEAIIVVGGRNSANTQNLGAIVEETGLPVYMVEGFEDLNLSEISKYSSVGVTAGASTPSWITEQIVSELKGIA